MVAFIGGGLAIGATNALLQAVDALSAGVVQAATGESLPQLGHGILSGTTLAAATTNPAGIILFSLAALVAVVIVWGALTVRKVLIVVSAVFAPLAFAGSLADITASWVRRWIEVTVALIVSKLILVVIFVIGLDMVVKGVGRTGGGGATQAATQAVSGVLVLALAGFSPWLALKLVHWSGDQFHQIHGLASASAAGASKAIRAPQKAMPWLTGAGAGAAAGVAGGAAASGAGTGAGAALGGTAGSLARSRPADSNPAASGASTDQQGASPSPRPQPATAGAAHSSTGANTSGEGPMAGSSLPPRPPPAGSGRVASYPNPSPVPTWAGGSAEGGT